MQGILPLQCIEFYGPTANRASYSSVYRRVRQFASPYPVYPPADYTQFNPLIYSLENSFPVVNLGVKERWSPKPEGATSVPLLRNSILRKVHDTRTLEHCASWLGKPAILRWWLWFHVMAGWVLSTLFVAGMTGIVKTAQFQIVTSSCSRNRCFSNAKKYSLPSPRNNKLRSVLPAGFRNTFISVSCL